VLEDEIECFMKCIDASTSKGQRLFRDADEWIAHEDKRWVFSFDNVCDMLDINPEYMRGGLRRWKDKRLDAIARRRAQMVLEAERAASEAALQPAGAIAAIAAAPVAAATAAAMQKPATKVAAKVAARVKRRPERVRIAKRASARKLRKARA